MYRFLLPVALLLLATPGSAQVESMPRVTLTMEVPESTSLASAESKLLEVKVVADLENIVCQGPSELLVELIVDGAGTNTLIVTGESQLALAFTTGPLGSTPFGPTAGIANQGVGKTNFTLVAGKTVEKDANKELTLTAKYDGSMPAGCQATQAPAASEVSAVHQVSISASPPNEESMTESSSSGLPDAKAKESPASVWMAFLVLGLAALRRRC